MHLAVLAHLQLLDRYVEAEKIKLSSVVQFTDDDKLLIGIVVGVDFDCFEVMIPGAGPPRRVARLDCKLYDGNSIPVNVVGQRL